LALSELLLRKADRFIRSARLLTDDGDLDSAVSRLYYAMFFTAEALLAERGLSFASHHAVISAYGQAFAKTAELDPRFHRALINGFSQRQLGDYDVEPGFVADDVRALREDAKAFLDAARQWIAAQDKPSTDK
jgi:uncharacterized protein (UPF0332 family)